MRSIENLGFLEANFKTVHPQLFHPHSHGVLGSLENLVTRSYKDGWRSRETLEQIEKSTKKNKLNELIIKKSRENNLVI